MGRTDTTNAVSRTTVTLAEGVDMNDILEELYKELVPDIPEHAVTIKMLIERGKGKITRNSAQRLLQTRHEKEGWNKVWYERQNWYWPPE